MPLCGVCLCKNCSSPLLILILKTVNNMPLKKSFGTVSGRDQKLFLYLSFFCYSYIKKTAYHLTNDSHLYLLHNQLNKISKRNFISLCNFTSRTEASLLMSQIPVHVLL